jgi:hypothetical protein
MIKVHETDDGSFVAADEGGWIPGIFDTHSAARLAALKLNDHDIVENLAPIYEHRPVTLAEVAAVIEGLNS